MTTLLDFSAGVATGGRGDTLSGAQLVDATISGTPVVTHVSTAATCVLSFAAYGHITHCILPAQATALSLSGGMAGQLQEITVMIQQSAEGGFLVTLPPGVIWSAGAPFIDSRAGAITFFRLWSLDGGVSVYGRAL